MVGLELLLRNRMLAPFPFSSIPFPIICRDCADRRQAVAENMSAIMLRVTRKLRSHECLSPVGGKEPHPNEYALFQLLYGTMSSVKQLRSEIESRYGSYADEIMDIYAPSDLSNANQAYIALMTDTMFRCASRRLARLVSVQGHRVYLYSFEEGIAMHSDEMTYVFGFFTLGVLPPV
jgi:hypothetical protein